MDFYVVHILVNNTIIIYNIIYACKINGKFEKKNYSKDKKKSIKNN